MLCCDSDSGECAWGTCAHCWHSHFHFNEVGIGSRVSFFWLQSWSVTQLPACLSATETGGELNGVGWGNDCSARGKAERCKWGHACSYMLCYDFTLYHCIWSLSDSLFTFIYVQTTVKAVHNVCMYHIGSLYSADVYQVEINLHNIYHLMSGQWDSRGEECVCVCACMCVRACLMCQLRQVLVSSYVHDSHRRRTLLSMLCSVWPHGSVLFVCALYVSTSLCYWCCAVTDSGKCMENMCTLLTFPFLWSGHRVFRDWGRDSHFHVRMYMHSLIYIYNVICAYQCSNLIVLLCFLFFRAAVEFPCNEGSLIDELNTSNYVQYSHIDHENQQLQCALLLLTMRT